MSRHIPALLRVLPVLAMLMAGVVTESHAQQFKDGSSYVVIALVPTLERSDTRALIVREPDARPQNYILVTEQTTPADLAKAIALLQRARRVTGDVLARGMRAHITPADPGQGRGSANLSRAAADLRRLPAADPYLVPGFGELPGLIARLNAVASRKPAAPLVRKRS